MAPGGRLEQLALRDRRPERQVLWGLPQELADRRRPRRTARKVCSNCSEVGHDKTTCKQPKVDFSKRKCFACHKTGRSSNQCPTRADVRIIHEEGDEEPAAALMLEDSSYSRSHCRAPTQLDNSFEALAEESDDEDRLPLQDDDSEIDDEDDDE